MASGMSQENEQFIRHELEAGAYSGRDELLNEAVTLLKRRRQLQHDIQSGIDSGAAIPAEEVFAHLEAKAKELARGHDHG